MTWLFAITTNAKEEAIDLDVMDVIGKGFLFRGVNAQDMLAQLRAAPRAKTLNVRVNSIGGIVDEGNTIRGVLRERAEQGTKVNVKILGLAASAATIVTDAGDDVGIAKGAYFMIHNAARGTGGRGTIEDHQAAVDHLKNVNADIVDMYVAASKRRGKNKTAEDFRVAMAKERYFTASEAVEWGLVDRVIEDTRVAASADLSRLSGAPEDLRAAYASVMASLEEPAPTPDPAPAPPAPAAAHDNSPARGEETPTMKLSKEVLALLGLTENADQAAIEAAIQTKCSAPLHASAEVMRSLGARSESEGQTRASLLTKLEIALLGATECSDASSALLRIGQWKLGAESGVASEARAKRLEGEVSTAKLDAAIERNSRDQVVNGVKKPARLAPAMHAWARASFQSADALETFLTSAPMEFATATVTERTSQDSNLSLTAEQKDVCKALGIPEDKYLETLKAERASAAAGA